MRQMISDNQYRWPALYSCLRAGKRYVRWVKRKMFVLSHYFGYTIEVEGIRIKVAASHANQLKPLVARDLMLKAAINATRKGDIVIDVGGWAGIYAVTLGAAAGELGKVFCFEPTPKSYSLLLEHIKLNHMQGIVIPLQQAVGNCKGWVTMSSRDLSSENRVVPGDYSGNGPTVRVPITSIDELCSTKGLRPRIIKIDVEGYELEVLRGAENVLMNHRPLVFCELHPHLWPDQNTEKRIGDLVDSLDYSTEPISEGKTVKFVCFRPGESHRGK